MSQTYQEPKCECGHYITVHLIPAHSPLKVGRCLRLTGCACEKFAQKESA